MKITNTSKIDNAFLRQVFVRTHNEMSKYEGRCRVWRSLRVTVRGSAYQFQSSGNAYVGFGPITLTFGHSNKVRDLVRLFWHEMMHVYGYKSHKGGRCDPHRDYVDAICEGLPNELILKGVLANKSRDLVTERYQRILAREKAWDKQLRHARTLLTKARRERREYEQRHGDRLVKP